MNDESSPDENENAHIRALLAELGSGPDGRPIPPEVAARLDDTLARLVAERGSGDGEAEEDADATGTVVPLRRPWLSRATAAAAAVIVVGAGGVAAANLGVFGTDRSMSSDAGGSSDSHVAESAPEATPTSPGARGLDAGESARETTGADAVPRIRAASFASDVSSLLRRGAVAALADEAPPTDSDGGGDTAEKSPPLETPEDAEQTPGNAFRSNSCSGLPITDGAVPNPIRYDGKLAVLVVHPKRDGKRLVEAWTCAGDRRLAETTITR